MNIFSGAVGTDAAPDTTALRLKLWGGGFYPVPVVTGGKHPLMRNWQEAVKQRPPAATAADTLNTGILAEGLRAIDIDVDDPAQVAVILAAATVTLGATPFIRFRCDSPRRLLLYRAAEGAPPKRQHLGAGGAKVEVLGRGQQFVAFGIHPDGAKLEWEREPGAGGSLADVPAATEGQVAELLSKVAAIIGSATADTTVGAPGSNVIPLPGTKAAVFSAAPGLPDLSAAARTGEGEGWFPRLPPNLMNDLLAAAARDPAFAALADQDRGGWFPLLAGFRDAERLGANAAFEIAKEWSRTSRRYPGDDSFAVEWRGVRAGGAGVGTLLHKLKQVGFDLSPWRTQKPPAASSPAASAFSAPISLSPTDWDAPDWIVPGMLLRGAMTVVAAAGAGSKTTLSVGLCAAMAAGRTTFGPLDIVQAPGGLKALYVAGEESRGRISMLAASAGKGQGFDRGEYQSLGTKFRVHDALASGFRLGVPRAGSNARIAPEEADDWQARLAEDVEANRPDVVVIDTGAALLAVPDENDNHVVTVLLRRLVRLASTRRCAVLVLLHTPKYSRDTAAALRGDASLVRGGSAWTTTPRAAWTITAVPDSEAVQFIGQASHLDSVRRFEPAKLNDGKMPAPVFFTTVSVELKDEQGNPMVGRAIRWLVPQAAATINAALDAYKRVALSVAIAGAKDAQGVTVPLSAAKTGASAGFKSIAAELQRHDPALSDRQAEGLAKQFIRDFLGTGVLTEEQAAIPKYKPDGKPNGTATRQVFEAHPAKAPWWVAANPMQASTPSGQPEVVVAAEQLPCDAEPDHGPSGQDAAPITTTVVE